MKMKIFVNFWKFQNLSKIPQNGCKQSELTFFDENSTFEAINDYLKILNFSKIGKRRKIMISVNFSKFQNSFQNTSNWLETK